MHEMGSWNFVKNGNFEEISSFLHFLFILFSYLFKLNIIYVHFCFSDPNLIFVKFDKGFKSNFNLRKKLVLPSTFSCVPLLFVFRIIIMGEELRDVVEFLEDGKHINSPSYKKVLPFTIFYAKLISALRPNYNKVVYVIITYHHMCCILLYLDTE